MHELGLKVKSVGILDNFNRVQRLEERVGGGDITEDCIPPVGEVESAVHVAHVGVLVGNVRSSSLHVDRRSLSI